MMYLSSSATDFAGRQFTHVRSSLKMPPETSKAHSFPKLL